MPPSLDKFAVELCLNIFSHLESVQDLIQCRLVCKTWCPLAERAIMRKQVIIPNESIAIKFCSYLKKKPELAYLINHIFLKGSEKWPNSSLAKELLYLAVTPNIITLEGSFSQESFECLLDIAQRFPQEFNKLQTLPFQWQFNYTGIETLLRFRKTLRELEMKPIQYNYRSEFLPQLIDRIEEFANLNILRFEITGDVQGLLAADDILGKLPKLHTLDVCENSDVPILLSKPDLNAWLERRIRKDQKVSKLIFGYVEYPQVVEYLLYKYPNVTEVEILSFQDFIGGTADRVFDAIKNIASVNIKFWAMNTNAELKQYISNMKSKDNCVRFCQDYTGEETTYDAGVVRKDGMSNFKIMVNVGETMVTEVFEEIMRSIGKISELDIDLSFRQHWDEVNGERRELSPFYKLLKIIPVVTCLKLTEKFIDYKPSLLDTVVLGNLNYLELREAVIDKRVLSVLSNIAPNLSNFVLDNCILDPMNPQSYTVIMPNAKLQTLSILSSDIVADERYPEKIDTNLQNLQASIRLEKYQMVSVQITRLSTKQVYFYTIQPGNPSEIREISENKYYNNTLGWPRIIIECNSLDSLSISLGALNAKIQLDTQSATQEISQ